MAWVRPVAVLAALLLLGPVLDPHAHDPYHTHWALGDRAYRAEWVPAARPHGPASPAAGHPPGVLWVRGADPSGPAVVHGGALLPAAAAALLVIPPVQAPCSPVQAQPLWTPPDLEPQDPPPRRA